MRQRELFEPAPMSKRFIPETSEAELVELLAQLMLSTFNEVAATDEEESNEPDQR
jgi:hypothetical protein